MYKLLLVSDKAEVEQAFAEMTDWERMGFRSPRIAHTTAEAIESMTNHHADAVAMELPPDQTRELTEWMNVHKPTRPIMRASDQPETVKRDVAELARLLNRTHMDYSNDRYSETERMQLERHRFFRDVLGGDPADRERMSRYLRLLRSKMDPDRGCVVIALDVPDDDDYLSGRWQYGIDRLEVAMRNIFGAELDGLRILVSVLPDDRIYLIAAPLLGSHAPQGDEMLRVVLKHAEWAVSHVRKYLNIDLKLEEPIMLASLLDISSVFQNRK